MSNRRHLLILLLLISFAVFSTGVTASAYAQTAAERCAAGSDSFNHYEILHMDGGRGKHYPQADNDVSNRLFPNDQLRIEPTPDDRVKVGPFDPSYVAAGISPRQLAPPSPTDWPGPSLNKFSLLLMAPGVSPIEVIRHIEREGPCFRVPANVSNVQATLAINDPKTWDNSGAWNVSIKHYWAP